MINSPSKNVDLTKLSNIGDRAKIATLYAQGALAANRSAIALMGFDPTQTDLSVGVGKTNIAGAFDPTSGKIWMNAETEGRAPSTIVHESIHKGLAKLKSLAPEAKEIMKRLPNEELVVRYMMATKMGNPEEGTGDISDKQRKSALALFDIDKRYVKDLERLEELAAEARQTQRPRGPR